MGRKFMNKTFLYYLFVVFISVIFTQAVWADSINFDDKIYNLKSREITKSNIIENEYFYNSDSKKSWTSMIEVQYFPDIKNPLKYSNDKDEMIEKNERCVLLKLVQNKKQDIAVISYLENVSAGEKTYFVYNVCKYQKYQNKGMIALRYAKRYDFLTHNDIKNIAYEVRKINDEYMEKLIMLEIPDIVSSSDSKKKTH